MENLTVQIISILILGIVSILVKEGVILIKAITNKIGNSEQLTAAKEVWNIVEEKFRITENAKATLGSKMDMFDNLLLAKFPSLTKKDLEYLRQAIAGEVNKGKETITDTSNLEGTNAQLQQENATLKAQLNAIQLAIATPVVDNTTNASTVNVTTQNATVGGAN